MKEKKNCWEGLVITWKFKRPQPSNTNLRSILTQLQSLVNTKKGNLTTLSSSGHPSKCVTKEKKKERRREGEKEKWSCDLAVTWLVLESSFLLFLSFLPSLLFPSFVCLCEWIVHWKSVWCVMSHCVIQWEPCLVSIQLVWSVLTNGLQSVR